MWSGNLKMPACITCIYRKRSSRVFTLKLDRRGLQKKIVLQRSLCADLRSGCCTSCLYLPHPAKWFALTDANLHWHCAKIAEATGDHTHSRCWPLQTFKAFPFRTKHVLRLSPTLHHVRERSVIFWDVTNWSRTVWPNHWHETPSRSAFYHCVYRATACSLGRSIQFIGFLGLLESRFCAKRVPSKHFGRVSLNL